MGARHVRRDFRGSLGQVETLASGALRVPASVTRIGIFEYLEAGILIRELRPPEEVFDPESLASLRGVPVTDLHPDVEVTAETWPLVARGHAADEVGPDRDHVRCDLVVSHADLVEKVRARERPEVSCGYSCELEDRPGEWFGRPYDRVQRRIRYDHVALGPRDWARGGPTVRLHLDSKETTVEFSYDRKTRTLRIDGVDYALPADRDKALVAARGLARKAKRADQADPAQVVAALDEIRGHLEVVNELVVTLGASLSEADAQLEEMADQAVDPEELDQLVAEKADAVERARRLAPKLKTDGLSAAEIRRRALEAAGVGVEGESDDFVRGVFRARTDSLSALSGSTFSREDVRAMDEGDEREAGDADRSALTGAWRKPRGRRASA